MNISIGFIATCVVLTLHASQCIAKEVDIPFRSGPGDKGTYRIIEISRSIPVVKTLHRRDGPSGTTYTRSEIDCSALKYREMGSQDDTPKGMKIRPTRWTEFVPGSIKNYLAIAACSHQF